ncbi:nodulation efficiency protein D [Clostridium novyi B str. ATCC 27606]|uniref:Nodulation efficiency protein D n=2 Tax=Clostridium TaxID=1485 RepID=A0AA40IT48_CLONO|nr:NfeD family protein [Clostridium haemolyticum]KEI14903.1 nodulation efficiency protein D [Clostridium novyi B str. ATCC 27606]KEI15103.1 nodulation efficiency protein D [Clostridium haemolyticum NCTC 9693]KEI15201.1 nodulation efficiency protein D [Clostridium novyi B str. NCTC 9691]KGN01417.1 nodulation efficiency protein D [Clostridium haemolyticum NCTC 8350]OOB76486.1 nodulation efficiency protein D [Clostridium haemolyticum]
MKGVGCVNQYLILWIIISIVALVVDISTSSFLFIWFTIGGVVSTILTLMGCSFIIQVISFIIVSLILMVICYPIIKRTIKNTVPITPTMEEKYIGEEFIIKKDIEEKASIKYNGIYWTVKSVNGNINKGSSVKIIGIDGNKLLIKKI